MGRGSASPVGYQFLTYPPSIRAPTPATSPYAPIATHSKRAPITHSISVPVPGPAADCTTLRLKIPKGGELPLFHSDLQPSRCSRRQSRYARLALGHEKTHRHADEMIEDNRERDGVESERQSERLWGLSWTFLLGEKKKRRKQPQAARLVHTD